MSSNNNCVAIIGLMGSIWKIIVLRLFYSFDVTLDYLGNLLIKTAHLWMVKIKLFGNQKSCNDFSLGCSEQLLCSCKKGK
jgi:hypothetical protein